MQAVRLAVVLHGSSLSPIFPIPFRVEDLGISMTWLSSGQDGMAGDHEKWLEVVCSFNGARDFQISDKLTNDILRALLPTDGEQTSVLPAMRHLCIDSPMAMNEPSWSALLSFVSSRSLSGRTVQVNVPLALCHICHAISGKRMYSNVILQTSIHTEECACIAPTLSVHRDIMIYS